MSAKKLILLVEDEPDIGQKMVQIIEALKNDQEELLYQVIWAQNGYDALKLFKKHNGVFSFIHPKIECIFLDLRMPKMDGQQCLEQIRKIEKMKILSRLTPVVFLTAYEDDEKWASALLGMATDYLKKPVSPGQLKGTLKIILEEKNIEILNKITRDKGLYKRDQYQIKNTSAPSANIIHFSKKFLGQKTIMLLEDEEDVAVKIIEIIQNITDQKGRQLYKVVWGRNGVEGIKLLRKHRSFLGFARNKIQCILLDIRMPEMDGLQFLKNLRGIEKSRKLFLSTTIPVVLLTAYEDEDKWYDAQYNLVCEYLVKPISPAKLIETLHRIFFNYDAGSMAADFKEKAKSRQDMYNAQSFDVAQEIKNVEEEIAFQEDLDNFIDRKASKQD
jgi:CheY-like chemotaxis protein